MKAMRHLAAFNTGLRNNMRTIARDSADGFFEIFRSGIALIGLVTAVICLVLFSKPDLRQSGETELLGWLQLRHGVFSSVALPADEEATADLDASERATAADPADLPKQQAAVVFWLSKKYKVAPEPLSALVAEAFAIGAKAKLEPTLILAIMAIESGFNPFAQSPVGAQGLMQVMTKIHSDKYEDFGGKLAAFDPITNMRVGVKVLQGCIAQAGSIEGGLKYYVGAANLASDGGYANKVIAEYARLYQVAYKKAAPKHKALPETTEPNMQRADAPSLEAQQPGTKLGTKLGTKPDSQPDIQPGIELGIIPVKAPGKPATNVISEKIASL